MSDKPLFSPKSLRELEDEYGDSDTALRIAATEMDGANEVGGNIDSTQTYCQKLNYDENLPASLGGQEGRKKCNNDLKDFLERTGYSSVQDWIDAQTAK